MDKYILLEWGSGVVRQALRVDKHDKGLFILTQEWPADEEKNVVYLFLSELEEITRAARKYMEETCLK